MPTGQNPIQSTIQAAQYYKFLLLLFILPFLPRERLVASPSKAWICETFFRQLLPKHAKVNENDMQNVFCPLPFNNDTHMRSCFLFSLENGISLNTIFIIEVVEEVLEPRNEAPRYFFVGEYST